MCNRYIDISNFQPQLLRCMFSDWLPQSLLSAHILRCRIWKLIAPSVAVRVGN